MHVSFSHLVGNHQCINSHIKLITYVINVNNNYWEKMIKAYHYYDRYSSWIHIAVTWQSIDGGWDFYVNGFLYTSGSGLQAGSYVKGGGSLVVGQEQDSFGGAFVRSEAFIGELSQVGCSLYSTKFHLANSMHSLSGLIHNTRGTHH